MLVKKKLFSLLMLLFMLAGNAQQEMTVPLKAVLEEISTKNKVIFNYIDQELIIFKIVPPKEELTLSEKIAYIQSKTGLTIKKISETYYSIVNDKGLDKPLCGYLLDLSSEMPIDNATIK